MKWCLRVWLIVLLSTACLGLAPEQATALDLFRFDFREAVIRDASYQQLIGKYGNEIFDFSYGPTFLNEAIHLYLGFGLLNESGWRTGVQTGRVSDEAISMWMIRQTAGAVFQLTTFGVRPFVEGAVGFTYFRIKEEGVEPAKTDGWKWGPIGRAGINFSLRELAGGRKKNLIVAEEIDVRDILISLAVSYEAIGIFQHEGLNLSNYSGSVGIQMVY